MPDDLTHDQLSAGEHAFGVPGVMYRSDRDAA